MTEPKVETPPAPPAVLPRVTITFSAPGSADMTVAAEGQVSLGQLMAAAFLLDAVAHEARAGQATKDAMNQLVMAPGGLPPEIERLLRNGH